MFFFLIEVLSLCLILLWLVITHGLMSWVVYEIGKLVHNLDLGIGTMIIDCLGIEIDNYLRLIRDLIEW